jgi:hypothetical protein
LSLREELEAIYDLRGMLTPALVVDEARRPDHPLHSRFEWDDEKAGEAYRHSQAQTLIRSVRIRYVSSDSTEVSDSVRAFTAVRTSAGYAYQPTLEVVMDPLRRQMVLADMKREWTQMRRRWESYEQFWELVKRDVPEELVSADEISA